MIRVSSGACGYAGTSGYTCQAFAKLDPFFSGTDISCIGSETLIASEFDNYGNLPVRAKGFVMQQPGTLNGGIKIPDNKVPELVCSVDTDPFTASGYWNMYASFETTKLWWGCEYQENGATSTTTGNVVGNLLCFVGDASSYTLTPGILEPMVNTAFDPIAIDAITNFDASIDGIMLTLMMITKWRKIIEERLNELALRPTGGGGAIYNLDNKVANGLVGLLKTMGETTTSGCQFKITKRANSSDAIQLRINAGTTQTVTNPIYDISGGTVLINNTPETINALQDIGVGTTVYLVIHFQGTTNVGYTINTAQLQTALPTAASGELVYTIPIGGVTKYDGEVGEVTSGNAYTYFEPTIVNCPRNISMTEAYSSDGNPGVVYYTDTGNYIVMPTATCDQDISGGTAANN